MIGHLRTITTDELRKLKKDPDSIKAFLHRNQNTNSGDAKAALLRVQEIARQAKAAGKTTDPKENEKVRDQILKELESAMAKRPSAGLQFKPPRQIQCQMGELRTLLGNSRHNQGGGMLPVMPRAA
jgi:hypothetical protein